MTQGEVLFAAHSGAGIGVVPGHDMVAAGGQMPAWQGDAGEVDRLAVELQAARLAQRVAVKQVEQVVYQLRRQAGVIVPPVHHRVAG